MSVSAVIVTAVSSKVSSASFKLSIREQKPIKVTHQNFLLGPAACLTTHFKRHASYTAASTVNKPFRAQTTLHGINPHASLDKDASYSLNKLIIFQLSFAKLTQEFNLFFFGLTIYDSCCCAHSFPYW